MVVAAALGAAAAWLATTVALPVAAPVSYTATTVLIDSSSITGAPSALGSTSQDTVATLANLRPVGKLVADAIGYTGNLSELASKITAQAGSTPGFLRIAASSGDRAEAVTLADTFAEQLIKYLQEARRQRAQESLQNVQGKLDQLSDELASINSDVPSATPTEAAVRQARRTAITNEITFLGQLFQQYLGATADTSGLQIVEQATAVPAPSNEGFRAPRPLSCFRASRRCHLGARPLHGLAAAVHHVRHHGRRCAPRLDHRRWHLAWVDRDARQANEAVSEDAAGERRRASAMLPSPRERDPQARRAGRTRAGRRGVPEPGPPIRLLTRERH